MMDLSGAINSFLSGTYTVTRQSGSTYGTDGKYVAGAQSTLTISASVQPLSGRELERLPEGLRTRELKSIFTATQLRTQGSGQDPDLVSIDGDSYEVQQVDRWAELGNYWRAIALKVGS